MKSLELPRNVDCIGNRFFNGHVNLKERGDFSILKELLSIEAGLLEVI